MADEARAKEKKAVRVYNNKEIWRKLPLKKIGRKTKRFLSHCCGRQRRMISVSIAFSLFFMQI